MLTAYSYTNQRYDAWTGLYDYHARWYDASNGRFISQDPLGFGSGDDNLYRYVGNNPLTYTDPTGLCSRSSSSLLYSQINISDWTNSSVPSLNQSYGLPPSGPTKSLPASVSSSSPGFISNVLNSIGSAAIYVDQRAGQGLASLLGVNGIAQKDASALEIMGSFYGAAARAAGNEVVGFAKMGRELGYMTADVVNDYLYLETGKQIYNGYLSDTGNALYSGQLSIGNYALDMGSNLLTLGVAGEVKATYQYATGKISADQYSQTMGASGGSQLLAAKALQGTAIGNAPIQKVPGMIAQDAIAAIKRLHYDETGAVPVPGLRASTSASEGVAAQARGGTYLLRDGEAGQVMRTGRTKDLLRRGGEHARDPLLKDYEFEPVHRTDVYSEQRGLEQLLHDQYNPPMNRINPINPANPNRPTYLDAAQQYLNQQGGR